MRRAFTMVEMLVATMLVGVLTTLSVLTFQAVAHGWQASTDYLDKLQRTDYALNQLIISLRSAYYPETADENYGFFDPYDRSGDRPSDSDIIEWTKKGSALIGSENAMADSVHKVRVMILEEGDTEDGDGDQFETFRFREPIKKTGLYARAFIDPGLSAKTTDSAENNQEYYPQPTLVADGVVGFRCRTIKEPPSASGDGGAAGKKGGYEKNDLEDAYTDKKFPYKVELTLFIEKRDDDYQSQKERATVVRIVRLPIYEQSQDAEAGSATGGGGKKR